MGINDRDYAREPRNSGWDMGRIVLIAVVVVVAIILFT